MPVRACIDASTGLPAYRWGRSGRVFPYGHGTGLSQHGAFQLAAAAGQALRVRQLAHEGWAHGVRGDARRRPARSRGQRFSPRLEQSHDDLLRAHVDLARRLVEEYAGPELRRAQAVLDTRRQDADPFFAILSVVRRIKAALVSAAASVASGFLFLGREIDEDTTDATDRELSRLLTIPLATAAGGEGLVEAWVAENVGLITSLGDGVLGEIEQMVLEAATGGRPTLDLAADIQTRFSVGYSRASLIARDQTAKLSSRITQEQHQRYGITKYMWSTSGDARVRQDHADLDGTIQEYANPPIADTRSGKRGHPGEVWQCRCTGSAVLDDADEAALREQAVARQRSELVTLQASPTVQGAIPNYSKFSDWNSKRIAELKAGLPSAVGL